MRNLNIAVAVLCLSCASTQQDDAGRADAPGDGPAPGASPAPAETPAKTLDSDSAMTTVAGNTFIAPAGWSVATRGPATIITAPEGGSHLVLADVEAGDVQAALAMAWAAYRSEPPPKVKLVTPDNDKDGWTDKSSIEYETSPNDKRAIYAFTLRANGIWTIVIYDMADAIGEKRGAQVGLVFGKLLPKGYSRESFAGKTAHVLDEARIAELGRFVDSARERLHVPGVSLGLVQGGKIVFAGGFGVRELGKPGEVDQETRYIVASNTKALTTLMLAKLVAEDKLGWDTPAASLLPSFRLGDADTTSKVQVKHLICACTGMPRQDMEWLFEYGALTPAGAMELLATMQPTSGFGELFQYSNPLAAAAGFIGGHVAYPRLELGKAYDEAMRTRVFGPLGMKDTTFDFARAQKGNHATPHSPDIDGKMVVAEDAINGAVIALRPAGGAWSNVRDLLRYVQMELAEGKLENGKTYLPADILLARREPQVAIGPDTTYGMGLTVHTRYGVTVVNHGGDLVGFHSDMMWLPEHGVGAVVLTNADPGWIIRSLFRRKLLEVLFDGEPLADADLAADADAWFLQLKKARSQVVVPMPAEVATALAGRYHNDALGDFAFSTADGKTLLDVGEFEVEVASKANPDGTTSIVTISPGLTGIELVMGNAGDKRTVVIRDAQHEYVFTEM